MAYVECDECKRMVHFKPVDVKEFHKKYVDGNEPIYCFYCFNKPICVFKDKKCDGAKQ